MPFTSAVKYEIKRNAVRYCPGLLAAHWLRTGRCEPEAAYLRHLCDPARWTIDIGGLEGKYAAMALPHSKGCYIFEPQPAQAAQIRAFFAKVRRRVVIEEAALSDEDGAIRMKVPRNDPGRATIAEGNRLQDIAAFTAITVPRRRLDDYGLRDVGFIKIDVEGHEEAVIRGARETIAKNRPNLLIEIEERHNPGGLARLPAALKEWGYEGYFLEDGRLKPLGAFSRERYQNDAGTAGREPYVNNFIFVSEDFLEGLSDALLLSAPSAGRDRRSG